MERINHDFDFDRGDSSEYESRSQKKFDSDTDESRVKHKSKDKSMGCYAKFKILNSFLYLATLCIGIGYFMSTKFTTKFSYYLFSGTLVVRPMIIALYSLVTILLECQRRKAKHGKKSDGLSDSEREMSDMSNDIGSRDAMNIS